MINKTDKNANRTKRHFRVRNKVSGTSACPRLNVYRSLNGIYAQVIDDQKGITLASASTLDKEISEKSKELNKTEQAKLVGTVVAERAKTKGVENVVFDRGGYAYTGRVKALADGAREAGLVF